MNDRDERSSQRIEGDREASWDQRYVDFFDCFNRGHYFEAHEVLEGLWLTKRRHPDGPFYQSLIQVAGAFVHVQQQRPGPAAALLRRAQHHLSACPATHQGLAVTLVLDRIAGWLAQVEAAPGGPWTGDPPRLELGGLGQAD